MIEDHKKTCLLTSLSLYRCLYAEQDGFKAKQ